MDIQVLYNKLLKLYPSHYQKRFCDAQAGIVEELIDEKGNGVAVIYFIVTDTFYSLIIEYFKEFRSYIISNDMKENRVAFFVSSILLIISALSVFLLSIIQYASKNMSIQNKFNSITFVIIILFVLPGISLVVSLVKVIQSFTSSWNTKYLGEYVMNYLPVLSTLVLSFLMLVGFTGLFFYHDSAHCLKYINQGIKNVRVCMSNS